MAAEWTEINKKCIGFYMSEPGRYGYYSAIYEVAEVREQESGDQEWRTRVENGKPCRDRTEGYGALVSLYLTFLERAKRKDEDSSIGYDGEEL